MGAGLRSANIRSPSRVKSGSICSIIKVPSANNGASWASGLLHGDCLTVMRDMTSSNAEFRAALRELATLLVYEATRTLERADVPSLRRVRAQNFGFRPGIEVTDVRQVKGLEFDYVVMLDVNASTYSQDDESRHLFHIDRLTALRNLRVTVKEGPGAK